MQPPLLHRFQIGDKRFVIDPSTCFCFECDPISWDVLEHYPHEPVNRIYFLLKDKHPRKELEEVVGELEWLRVTKAILIAPKDEDSTKETAESPTLKQITVAAASGTLALESRITLAGNLLLAGSGKHTNLHLVLDLPKGCPDIDKTIAALLKNLKQAARLAGKTLNISLQIPLQTSYRLRTTLQDTAELPAALEETKKISALKFGKIADALQRTSCFARTILVAYPETDRFGNLLQSLYDAGFRDVLLDVPALYAQTPDLVPAAVAESLRENVAWYAQQLLQRRYFRAEPFAELFDAVHQGKPIMQADESGCGELAVDSDGCVYPSLDFLKQQEFALGRIDTGGLNTTIAQTFEALGANRIPACHVCWARCLCGGGHAIIHQQRTGNPRQPDPAWCNAQRAWLAHLIDAFNVLVSSGINFSQITSAMAGNTTKMSWWKAAKTAYEMRIIPRPLQESDAAWLVRWENWNPAAYFVCTEGGMLLAASYDREMDALHPRGVEQELVLTRTDGTPCGLLRMRPDARLKGLAWTWLYMHDTKAYGESGVRRALKALLSETTKSQQIRRILIPVTPAETELTSCLESLGFHSLGVQRQALFLHNEYRDIIIYQSKDTY